MQLTQSRYRAVVTRSGPGFIGRLISGNNSLESISTTLLTSGAQAHYEIHQLAIQGQTPIDSCSGFIDDDYRLQPCGQGQSQPVVVSIRISHLGRSYRAQLQTADGTLDYNLQTSSATGGFASAKRAHQAAHRLANRAGWKIGQCSGFFTLRGGRQLCPTETIIPVEVSIEVFDSCPGFAAVIKSADGLVSLDFPLTTGNIGHYRDSQTAHQQAHVCLKSLGYRLIGCTGYHNYRGDWQPCDRKIRPMTRYRLTVSRRNGTFRGLVVAQDESLVISDWAVYDNGHEAHLSIHRLAEIWQLKVGSCEGYPGRSGDRIQWWLCRQP